MRNFLVVLLASYIASGTASGADEGCDHYISAADIHAIAPALQPDLDMTESHQDEELL
jgi:hypothetical protein